MRPTLYPELPWQERTLLTKTVHNANMLMLDPVDEKARARRMLLIAQELHAFYTERKHEDTS